jgi:ubiquinone/menaquinone biosynthesis C-methylase UbiE
LVVSTIEEFYKEAAASVVPNLCRVNQGSLNFPGLHIPKEMTLMNYGCGSSVPVGEIEERENILYVGVGSGLEALKLAYFTQRAGGVTAVDKVDEMLDVAARNLREADCLNDWFKPEFVALKKGDALSLPAEDMTYDIVAENCLFNIFDTHQLFKALSEAARVLKTGGRLFVSDPVTTSIIPDALRKDERLRAMCLSGALTYDDYIEKIGQAGFCRIEIRAKRPYRVLDKVTYGTDENIYLESVDLTAYKGKCDEWGPRVYCGETLLYFGRERLYDDEGRVVVREIPQDVSHKTAEYFRGLKREDLYVTEPTYHYSGSAACCS